MKIGTDFEQLPDLTVNNFGVEQDIVNRKSALKITDTPLGCVYFCPITKATDRNFNSPYITSFQTTVSRA